MNAQRPRRIAVAITGATGAVYGVRTLQRLAAMDVETHLVVSSWGRRTIEHETMHSIEEVRDMAAVVHPLGDQGAPMSSGSFRMDGMIIAPCSVRTMAAIAHGLADNLISRTADVMLKERRRLLLMVREAPLNDIHLQNMVTVSRAGAIVFPPMPAFYTLPKTIDDLVDQTVSRALDQLGLEVDDIPRWNGDLHRRRDREAAETTAPSKAPPASPDAGQGGDAFADTFEDAPPPVRLGDR